MAGFVSPPKPLTCLGWIAEQKIDFTVANWSNDSQRQLIDEFEKRTGEPWLTQDSLSTYGHVWILKEAVFRLAEFPKAHSLPK